MDKLFAFFALAVLALFLGFLVVRVPEFDLTLVVVVVLAMAAIDFVRELVFQRR